MSKKKIINNNKKNNDKKKFSEKDDILNDLAASLRQLPKDEERDNSDLEEDSRLNLENFDFVNFAGLDETSAPVLERIAGSQARPIFVGGIPQFSNTIPGEEKESDPFKYVPGQNADGGPKYIDADSHERAAAERVDFNRLGREGFQPEINQEAMFTQSPEARFESQFQEKVWTAERFDTEKERRRSQPGHEEQKYEKYKPDLPKSR